MCENEWYFDHEKIPLLVSKTVEMARACPHSQIDSDICYILGLPEFDRNAEIRSAVLVVKRLLRYERGLCSCDFSELETLTQNITEDAQNRC